MFSFFPSISPICCRYNYAARAQEQRIKMVRRWHWVKGIVFHRLGKWLVCDVAKFAIDLMASKYRGQYRRLFVIEVDV